MKFGRALLTGMGWAATLGGIALCVLVFLSAYVAFDGDRHGVGPRDDGVVKLPSVPEAVVPDIPLARPPGLAASESEGGAATGPTGPPRRSATRRETAPAPTAPGPGAGVGDPPGRGTPSPAPARPAPSGPGGGAGGASATPVPTPPPPPSPTSSLGDAARGITGAVGTEVGRVSPEAGQLIVETGDTAGDVVDAVAPPGLLAPR